MHEPGLEEDVLVAIGGGGGTFPLPLPTEDSRVYRLGRAMTLTIS